MSGYGYEDAYCTCDWGLGCSTHPRELTPAEKANHEKWEKIWTKRREKELK